METKDSMRMVVFRIRAYVRARGIASQEEIINRFVSGRDLGPIMNRHLIRYGIYLLINYGQLIPTYDQRYICVGDSRSLAEIIELRKRLSE